MDGQRDGSALIVAAESARFGLPEVGLIPGYGGTQRLPKAIGSRAALRIMLAGEQVDAARADELGVLSQPPVPDDDLLEVVGSLADFMIGETIIIDGGETAR
jgi:enoyl-CoA hydratase